MPHPQKRVTVLFKALDQVDSSGGETEPSSEENPLQPQDEDDIDAVEAASI
jgi:hypothetical protein